jgi:AraC family transcriptional regulator
MEQALLTRLAPPRIENGKSLLIAGLVERYTLETRSRIPSQWQRFLPHLGKIPGQVGRTTYGVLSETDAAGNTEYITGVEVSDFSEVPPGFSRVRIPERRYAVFTEHEHISTIQQVWSAIWNKRLAESGLQKASGPAFERYSESFDPVTGLGGFEIWVPVN